MWDTGLTINYTDMGSIPGQMAGSTRGSMSMMSRKDRGNMCGRMAGNTMDSGSTANNMEKASSQILRGKVESGFGIKAKEFVGLIEKMDRLLGKLDNKAQREQHH